MIDDLVKDHLHGQLRSIRQAPVCKLDGLPEYGVRRAASATNQRAWGHADGWHHAEASDTPRAVLARAVRDPDLAEARP